MIQQKRSIKYCRRKLLAFGDRIKERIMQLPHGMQMLDLLKDPNPRIIKLYTAETSHAR